MIEDLLKKKVSIFDPNILLFFLPHFQIIDDIKQPTDYSNGIIYNGTITDSIIKKIDLLSNGKYILLSDFAEIQLHKPSDFISIFMPTLKDKADSYNTYDLDSFMPIFKQYYLLNKRIPILKEEDSSIFSLYRFLLSSKSDVLKTYLLLLNKISVSVISASLLTFLIKVKEQNFSNCSPTYKKLINSAYLKFGSKIKPAVRQYIESDQKPEVALWFLLETLIS